MSIEVKCSGCGQVLRVKDEDAGKQGRCPKCQTTFTIPAAGSSPGSPTFGGVESKPELPFPQQQAPIGQQPQTPFGQQGQNPFSEKPATPAQNPYATPAQGAFPQAHGRPTYRKPHRGGTILTLGILAIVCNFCFIPGICAWTMGNSDLNAMRAGQMDPSGRGLTQAGQIMGIIGTILSVLLGVANVALRAAMN
jgi:hypothetical protein